MNNYKLQDIQKLIKQNKIVIPGLARSVQQSLKIEGYFVSLEEVIASAKRILNIDLTS